MKWKNLLTQEVTEDINKTKPYRAKYPGICYKCNNAINRGDVISWVRNGKGLKYHQNCNEPRTSPWILVDYNTTCSECCAVLPRHDPTCSRLDIKNEQAYETPTTNTIPEQFDGDKVADMDMPDDEPSFDIDDDSPKPSFKRPCEYCGITGGHEVDCEAVIGPKQASKSTGDGLLDLISSQVQAKVIENVQRKVDASMAKIDASVKEKLDQLSLPSIVIKKHGLPDIKIDNVHKQFKDVLQLLNAKRYVYLHGSPGGHKSSIGPQLAEALGVRYAYMSLSEQTPEYVVKGFTSPLDGKYYGSQFVDFYENGGLMCWEELDASNDNLRASLNTMLENGLASLDKGLVKKHPDFYFLANGNTCGRGAHPAFPSRTAFDSAFAARFFFLDFQYDWQLCQRIAVGINKQALPIAKWAEQVSNWALANGVQLVMSPREVYVLANLTITTDLDDNTLLDGVLRGLDVPSKEKLLSNFPFPHITR